MKRISSILLFIIFAFIISCGGGNKAADNTAGNNAAAEEDNSLQKVKDAGKLVLGLDDTFAPMGFRDENGEVVGFDIDLAREVANRLGVALEIKPIEWSSSILSLNKGDVDVLWNGVTINEARKQQINFSKPYLNNKLVIVKAVDDNTINSKDDLSGKVLGVQVGSNDEALTADPSSKNAKEIRRYDVNVNAFLDLQAKRIDAVENNVINKITDVLSEKLDGLDEVIVELIKAKTENETLRQKVNELNKENFALKTENSSFKPVGLGFYVKKPTDEFTF